MTAVVDAATALHDGGLITDLSQFAHLATRTGDDPDAVFAGELLPTIRRAIIDAPRSQQVELGPSELGHPCGRWLAHKLAGTPVVNPDRGNGWLPTVGTAVHTWLADAFHAANDQLDQPRWWVENRVVVGEVAGRPVAGSCDLYDGHTGTVTDWKVVGKTTLDEARRGRVSAQYRVQAHAYGRGWAARGVPVRTVSVAFLPRNAVSLDAAVLWHEPYDERVVLGAVARVDAIASLVAAVGSAAATVLPTADAYCGECSWREQDATDLSRACPGDQGARVNRPDAIHSLIA